MNRGAGAMAAVAALAALGAAPALGSGGPAVTPLYVVSDGGSPAELARLYAGRQGVVLADSPDHLLYLNWRLLHGLEVGAAAGTALSGPCCDAPFAGEHEGVYGWLDARAIVPGVAASPDYLPTERSRSYFVVIPNCYPDAFDTAVATLRNRVARHGARSPAVRAWLLTQDAVFDACSAPGKSLPPLMASPPAWLRADRAYQEAAFALYNGHNGEAAARFAGIARDRSSPWRPRALYLKARALQREALANPAGYSFAQSRAALAELAAAPAGTYGQSETRKMLRALAYRDQPDRLLAELDAELGEREPPADVEISLRDYLALSAGTVRRPDLADWIATMGVRSWEDSAEQAPQHALERWRATKDVAWLIAALTLTNADDPAASSLVADAARVKRGSPAWVTAQYHIVRLTIARAKTGLTRARLDALLARPGLTRGERNLFSAARAQVAIDLADLARFALREPYCRDEEGTCTEEDWDAIDETLGKSARTGTWVGLGADARAIIDRLPLPQRIAISRNARFPAQIRLDLALTSFARAVQLQDNVSIDRLAADLAGLLPQLRGDWRAIARARPGPAKRFAEYFVMAKLPGLRADLAINYTRPQGSVPQFQGYWEDWLILPRGTSAGPPEFPDPSFYTENDWDYSGDGKDLTCLGRCGGAFPLRLPTFVAAVQGKAAAERAAFGIAHSQKTWPVGTRSVWEEMLAYARAHPRDPRSPETLYWLIRVGRWGPNPDHLGRRAFQLLHARYPGSGWAKRSPYHYG